MKTILTNVLILILILNSYAQENNQWNILNEGQDLNLIDFVNENVGWIAGYSTLLKTTDAGETWMNLLTDENWSINTIDFYNELLGWAAIYSHDNSMHYLLKTIDGGQTWIILEEFQDINLNSIQVVDDSLLFAVEYYDNNGDYGNRIWKSQNAGTNWFEITPEFLSDSIYLESIHFFDANTGFVYGRSSKLHILRTQDGGINWQEQLIEQFSSLDEIHFSNDSTFYFLATSYSADSTKNYICMTTDTLKNWQVKLSSNSYILSIFPLDNNTIFAVMQDSVSYTIKTKDGGNNWEKKETFIASLQKVYFITSHKGILLGSIRAGMRGRGYPFLWQSTDAGESWDLEKFRYPITDVHFIDQQNGFFVGGSWTSHGGSNGIVLKTFNGANKWDFVPFTNVGLIGQCNFLDDKLGIIVERGWPGRIFKTYDSGLNWQKVFDNDFDSTGFWFNGNDVSFHDEDNIWVVGDWGVDDSSGAAILGTSDGGESWNIIWKYLNNPELENYYSLSSSHIINTTVWTVGGNGLIVKNTSVDAFKVLNDVTDLPLRDIFFSDAQHGWIAGGYFYGSDDYKLILLKTNNSGETWQEISNFNYKINDMFFTDSLHGWAVGNDTSSSGIILETIDGGDNWNTIVNDLSASLNALHFKDNVGWAVGDNGLILRTDNWTTWIDQNTGKIYPQKHQLYQNYPNPFNSISNLEFRISNSAHVNLSIYNLLGQKVATLVDKKQQAGSYKVEWDATDFSTGVYLYRLATEEYVETKKMILMK